MIWNHARTFSATIFSTAGKFLFLTKSCSFCSSALVSVFEVLPSTYFWPTYAFAYCVSGEMCYLKIRPTAEVAALSCFSPCKSFGLADALPTPRARAHTHKKENYITQQQCMLHSDMTCSHPVTTYYSTTGIHLFGACFFYRSGLKSWCCQVSFRGTAIMQVSRHYENATIIDHGYMHNWLCMACMSICMMITAKVCLCKFMSLVDKS